VVSCRKKVASDCSPENSAASFRYGANGLTLWTCQTKKPLLQDRVFTIPKRNAEAQVLVAVADSQKAIFVPPAGGVLRTFDQMCFTEGLPKCSLPCMVVWEKAPRIPVFTIVFSY
jgi:hypothetical protein